MRPATCTFGLVVMAVVAVAASGLQDADAVEQEYKPKVKEVSLLKAPLAGVKGKEVIIKHFEFPPGYVGGKHSHSGPVFVYVLEGELTIDTDRVWHTSEGAARQTIKAGER